MLCGLSSDTAFLRVRCLPSALLPLADTTDGRAGSQSDWALWMVSTPTTLCLWCLSERRPLWPRCVLFFAGAGQMSGGGGSQRQETKVMGRSSRWKEGGARWRFRERYIFTMATSLTVNHMQPQCAVHIRPSRMSLRGGVCSIYWGALWVRELFKQKRGGGGSGLHAQPSQRRSFRKAGLCLLTK